MRKVIVLAIIILVTITLAACQSNPMLPTPTPIPLAATVTTAPRVAAPTVSPATAQPTIAPVATTVSRSPVSTSDLLPELDDFMAHRAVEVFLRGLTTGKEPATLALLLTASAREGLPGSLLFSWTGQGLAVTEATMESFAPSPPSSYEALARIGVVDADGNPSTQIVSMRLVYDRGLWKIDAMDLLGTPTPTP